MSTEPITVTRERLVRGVGVAAERHWWVSRIQGVVAQLRHEQEIAEMNGDPQACLRAAAYQTYAEELDALIAEREA